MLRIRRPIMIATVTQTFGGAAAAAALASGRPCHGRRQWRHGFARPSSQRRAATRSRAYSSGLSRLVVVVVVVVALGAVSSARAPAARRVAGRSRSGRPRTAARRGRDGPTRGPRGPRGRAGVRRARKICESQSSPARDSGRRAVGRRRPAVEPWAPAGPGPACTKADRATPASGQLAGVASESWTTGQDSMLWWLRSAHHD